MTDLANFSNNLVPQLRNVAKRDNMLSLAGKFGVVNDIEEMQQVVPLITRDPAFCQNVCELVFGFDILDLDFWVQVDSIK